MMDTHSTKMSGVSNEVLPDDEDKFHQSVLAFQMKLCQMMDTNFTKLRLYFWKVILENESEFYQNIIKIWTFWDSEQKLKQNIFKIKPSLARCIKDKS